MVVLGIEVIIVGDAHYETDYLQPVKCSIDPRYAGPVGLVHELDEGEELGMLLCDDLTVFKEEPDYLFLVLMRRNQRSDVVVVRFGSLVVLNHCCGNKAA